MATVFGAIALSILACMVHAAVKLRWDLVQGGGVLLALFLALTALAGGIS